MVKRTPNKVAYEKMHRNDVQAGTVAPRPSETTKYKREYQHRRKAAIKAGTLAPSPSETKKY